LSRPQGPGNSRRSTTSGWMQAGAISVALPLDTRRGREISMQRFRQVNCRLHQKTNPHPFRQTDRAPLHGLLRRRRTGHDPN
jgi:hypothetical protein